MLEAARADQLRQWCVGRFVARKRVAEMRMAVAERRQDYALQGVAVRCPSSFFAAFRVKPPLDEAAPRKERADPEHQSAAAIAGATE